MTPLIFSPSLIESSSFFSFVLGVDEIISLPNFTIQDFIFSSAQCMII